MIYKPHGGASQLWKCRAREILIDGPAGTGKSRACCEKVDAAMRKWAGSRALFVRKTRASLTESILVTYEARTLGPNSRIARGQKRSHRQSYNYPNGSIIVCGGLDNVDRIMSTEYDLIYCAEATEISEDDWEKMLTRLRNNVMPFQQAIADCNPSSQRHWLKMRSDDGHIHRIRSVHADNPSLDDKYIESLSRLTGHRRSRLFEGKWCAAEGIIYDMWDEGIFVGQFDQYVPVQTYIGIDEGYTNPCSKHLYHLDNDGRIYIADEDYKTGQLEKNVVEIVKKWYIENANTFEAVIVDPSAAKLIAAMRNADIPVIAANNDVYDGIKAVQERLVVSGDGSPRLKVDPKCVALIDEIGAYAWKENRDGSREDKPMKINDHAMDELRYVCMYLSEHDNKFEAFEI